MSDKWQVVQILKGDDNVIYIKDIDGKLMKAYLDTPSNPIMVVITRNDIKQACESYCKSCDDLVVSDVSNSISKQTVMEYLREVVTGVIEFNLHEGSFVIDDEKCLLTVSGMQKLKNK